ncbi:MAG: hypothetical protein ACK2UK_03740 [Candidatus Promineifilaceae bacterium]
MATEILTAETGTQLAVNYPDSIPAPVAKAASPAAVRVLIKCIKAGYDIADGIDQEIVRQRVQRAFRQEAERIMHQDIVPIVGAVGAHQFGRDWLRSMGLDADLEEEALAALKERQQKSLYE